jgi:inosine-uridine nucleoside N-ribohydrolase
LPAHTIVLDVDTGTDDALAVLSAVQHPEISIARQIAEAETAVTSWTAARSRMTERP